MTSPRTPRQLLGWTVPEHVRFVGGQGFVTVACGTCNSVTTPALSLRDDAERIDAWLREHAHGSPRTPMGYRLREILYRPTPSDSALPAPRVFFPGDTVPAGMWVAPYGEPAPFAHGNAWTVHQYDSPVVEIHVPSREEWEATVDRAKAERVGLCDGCDSTRHPVKASDDGRAQFCPTCLPKANAPASAPGTGEA